MGIALNKIRLRSRTIDESMLDKFRRGEERAKRTQKVYENNKSSVLVDRATVALKALP